MKKIWLLVSLCMLSVASAILPVEPQENKKEKVGGLVEQIAQQEAEKQIKPLQEAEEVLEKRVDTVEGKLNLCQKGLEELGSAEAEDPVRRKLILGGCAGAGAVTAIIFLLLL